MNGQKVTAARTMFEQIIDQYECYEGQICICSATFRRELMIPILAMIKQLEKAADDQ